MRIPSFPTFLRTFYTFSNATILRYTQPHLSKASGLLFSASINSSYSRSTFLYRSMPSIPLLGSLFSTKQPASEKMSYPDKRSDDEWRAVLSPQQFRVIREKGTEAPFSGAFDKHMPDEGVYTCAACNAPLYKAEHKFKSGCGWPAYFDALPGAVTRHTDSTFGMQRTEIVCTNCGGHLGHVFKGEGYKTPTDERHCVNSVSLKFSKDEKNPEGAKAGDN